MLFFVSCYFLRHSSLLYILFFTALPVGADYHPPAFRSIILVSGVKYYAPAACPDILTKM